MRKKENGKNEYITLSNKELKKLENQLEELEVKHEKIGISLNSKDSKKKHTK